MAEHTPGPWAIKRSPQGYPYQITAPHVKDGPGKIIEVTRWAAISCPSLPEGEANARLIAAAPDLREALENLTKRCIQSGLENTDFPVKEALAAIAKARDQSDA